MTAEHFWHRPQGVKGKRAPDDRFHLVACCQFHNAYQPPSHIVRMRMREYIAHKYNLDLEALLRGDYEVS